MDPTLPAYGGSMSIEYSAQGNAAAVAAPTIGRLVGERRATLRLDGSSARLRAIRFVGRAFVGMPASSWMVVDLICVLVAVHTAYELVPPYSLVETTYLASWQASAIFAFAVIIASLVFGLYERETLMGRSRILTRMLLTTASAGVIAYALIYVVMYATVSRRVSGLTLACFFAAGSGLRLAAFWAIEQVHHGLLIVGTRALYESFQRAQTNGFLHEYRLVGYASTETEPAGPVSDPANVGRVGDQVAQLTARGISHIVVGATAAKDPTVMEWMVPCLQAGCRVTNEAIFYEKATGQILVDEITPYWFLFADLKLHCDEHATLKRVIDLVTSAIGLLLTAPLCPLVALAIKLCDGGPVFYSQDRVGQNGVPFRLFKFRTMRIDAESGKSIWCAPNDPRVTAVGRVLRRTRLDELPQLFNVLMGQMSIVGPRPERPDIVGDLCAKVPYYAERHLAKPGITGWAQISFRYGSSTEDAKRKLQFDLYYLKHMSFELDMIILFRTLGTFLRGAC